MQLNPHLNFNGQCEAAFKYYEKHLGAKIEFMMNYADSPMGEKTPTDWRNKIIHATIKIGGTTAMGADAPPDHFKRPQGFYLSLDAQEPEEAARLFKALAENGKVEMPMQKTFWARRFGMLVDQFGIPWMINCGNPA
jgi:PhnB protein